MYILLQRVYFIMCLFCISHGKKYEPLSLPNGSRKCYLRCVAKCLETIPTLKWCSKKCEQYEDPTTLVCHEQDTRCWRNCGNLTDVNSVIFLPNPVILNVDYSVSPSPNPQVVTLEWTHVLGAQLYTVQYINVNDVNATWDEGGHEHLETTSNRTTIEKNSLCSEYSFRVAAVNKDTVGFFSDVVTLEKPVPFIPDHHDIVVVGRELLNKEYIDITGKKISNNTVRVTVRYTPPPGWSLAEIIPEFGKIHLFGCKECRHEMPSFVLPVAQLAYNEPVAYFEFPEFVCRCECTFSMSLEYIKTTCDTVVKYETAKNYLEAVPLLLLNFTCENTKYANCYKPPKISEPICSVDNFEYETNAKDNPIKTIIGLGNVTIKWVSLNVAHKVPIEYWIVHVVEAEKISLFDYPTLSFNAINDLGFHIVCDQHYNMHSCAISTANNTNVQINVDNLFKYGSFYCVQICAIYNKSTENKINWNITSRYMLDFTENTASKPFTKQRQDQSVSSATIGLSIGLAVVGVLAIIFIALVIAKRKSAERMSINEFTLREKRANDNHYVTMPH